MLLHIWSVNSKKSQMQSSAIISSPGCSSAPLNSPARPKILVSIPEGKEDWIVHPWNVLILLLNHPEQSL